MRACKQSTARTIMVLMVDSTDHVTGKTGLTLTITASKAGAAFASITPTVIDRGSGWYSLALTASHLDTLGDFAMHITGAAADPADLLLEVVAYNPEDAAALGLSRIDAAVSTRSTQTSVDTVAGYIDTEVAAILAAVDTEVAAIKAKTDNLPADPADESLLEAAIAAKADPGDAMALTGAAVSAILDSNVEGTMTLRQALRVVLAVLAGKASGAPTGPLVYRDVFDTKNRVSGAVDTDGNRTSVTIDVS